MRIGARSARRIRRGIWAARACEWVGEGLAWRGVAGDRLAEKAYLRCRWKYVVRKQERLGWEVA